MSQFTIEFRKERNAPVLFNETTNSVGLQEMLKRCRAREVSWLAASLFPVRTDNCRDLCTDLFFPTFLHTVLKMKNFWEVVLLPLLLPLCLLWDVSTLLVRLITVIPRAYYNKHYSKEEHPLYQYLRAKQAPQELLEQNRFLVEISWHNGQAGVHSRERVSLDHPTVQQNLAGQGSCWSGSPDAFKQQLTKHQLYYNNASQFWNEKLPIIERALPV